MLYSNKILHSYFKNKNDISIAAWVAPEGNIDWKTLEMRSCD